MKKLPIVVITSLMKLSRKFSMISNHIDNKKTGSELITIHSWLLSKIFMNRITGQSQPLWTLTIPITIVFRLPSSKTKNSLTCIGILMKTPCRPTSQIMTSAWTLMSIKGKSRLRDHQSPQLVPQLSKVRSIVARTLRFQGLELRKLQSRAWHLSWRIENPQI